MSRDTEKLLKAAELSRNGHHLQASRLYQAMGNEYRNPEDKDRLWKLAENSRRIHETD